MAADAQAYWFELGELDCLAVADGWVDYPPGHLFSGVARAEIEKALQGRDLPVDTVTTPCTHLCVDTGEQRVLVDMGAGGLAPRTGKLCQNLRAAGIEAGTIGVVIITHAHPAHVGGALDAEGRPIYPNARYVMWKGEWDFWTSEGAFAKASERHVRIARRNLEPIRERLELVDRECEVAPGISVIPARGHTPGHIAVSVATNGERLLYVGDAVMHVLHVEHPEWAPIYDIDPDEAAGTRRCILGMATCKTCLFMSQHLHPFPSLGHVVQKGAGWEWLSIEARDMKA
jgi:glyoxylase-like metal-dependent hydrolase (beta-lactamase superfamily II)